MHYSSTILTRVTSAVLSYLVYTEVHIFVSIPGETKVRSSNWTQARSGRPTNEGATVSLNESSRENDGVLFSEPWCGVLQGVASTARGGAGGASACSLRCHLGSPSKRAAETNKHLIVRRPACTTGQNVTNFHSKAETQRVEVSAPEGS